ncbi:MAG: hypothetical protein ACYTEK_25085 [Planctomycetota bacterium]
MSSPLRDALRRKLFFRTLAGFMFIAFSIAFSSRLIRLAGRHRNGAKEAWAGGMPTASLGMVALVK